MSTGCDMRMYPVGPITVMETDGAITRLEFEMASELHPTPLTDEAFRQLDEYFAGQRQSFDLPIAPKGTPFQLAVWQALQTIPYGETRSYAQVAAQLNNPRACRAVGGANHRNNICILIPCHRVIAADGGLGGFGSGLHIKQALLALEKSTITSV